MPVDSKNTKREMRSTALVVAAKGESVGIIEEEKKSRRVEEMRLITRC
jgi:hypothetical protein